MFRLVVSALLPIACAAAWAQAPAPRSGTPEDPRRNQKVERIVHEDAANRIEETRYAGQTENITVRPKGDAPAYEVTPATPGRNRVADERNGSYGGGQRFWNVLNF